MAELFLEHNGRRVYETYRDYQAGPDNRMAAYYHYSTKGNWLDADYGTYENGVFDVRDLARSDAELASCEDYPDGQERVIRAAIDRNDPALPAFPRRRTPLATRGATK